MKRKEKLKTLKEMYYANMEDLGIEPVARVSQLRNEAAKWVKYYKENWREDYHAIQRTWIINFFNLKEEDLG